MRPKSVNILGTTYRIIYCDKPSDVDIFHRESLFGQIDYWTGTIRVFDNGTGDDRVWHTIIHEVLHGIGYALKLKLNEEEHHEELDTLSIALFDTFQRNGWLKEPAKKKTDE